MAKRFGISDLIRDILTEVYLELNLKYGKKATQRIFANFLFMSNHPDALSLASNDRRINVFSGPDYVQDQGYYNRLYAWLETDGVAQLYYWLMGLDLTRFNWQRSMDTPARTRMIHYNRTETEILFWDLMEKPSLSAHDVPADCERDAKYV